MLLLALGLVALRIADRRPRSRARATTAATQAVPVPCPLTVGKRKPSARGWDFGLPFEAGAALAGRAPRCEKIGELSVPTGQLQRLETSRSTVELGRVAPGRYPVIRAITDDASYVAIVFKPGGELKWDWVRRDDDARPVARMRDVYVFDARLAPSRPVGELPPPGVDGDGAGWVHPGFGLARAVDERGDLAALAASIPEPLEIQHFRECRRAPPPKIPPPSEKPAPAPGTKVPCDAILGGGDKCVSAGELIVTTGRVVATDPLTELEECPLDVAVPIGRYPVRLAMRDGDVARALVALAPAPAVRWTRATQTTGDPANTPVDAGTWGFLDMHAADRLLRSDDWNEKLFAARGPVVVDADGADLVAFHSGAGDGVYQTWLGFAGDGKLVALVTDFELELTPSLDDH